MDIKRVLTALLGLPIIALILIYGNNTIIDIVCALVAIIRNAGIFWSIRKK